MHCGLPIYSAPVGIWHGADSDAYAHSPLECQNPNGYDFVKFTCTALEDEKSVASQRRPSNDGVALVKYRRDQFLQYVYVISVYAHEMLFLAVNSYKK